MLLIPQVRLLSIKFGSAFHEEPIVVSNICCGFVRGVCVMAERHNNSQNGLEKKIVTLRISVG